MTARPDAPELTAAPTGPVLCYPTCGDWACEQDADWRWIAAEEPVYSAVKREWKIRWKCTPRQKWPTVLQETRRKRNGGLPLWMTA